jgi:hypothetical protein
VVSSAASPDRSPATTSTSFMTGAGLKKCMPTTRSAPGTPAAISVTLSEEVFVASTQSSRTTSATRPNSSRLSSSDSGAASITTSAPASAATSAAASSGPAAPSASRPFSTSRSSRLRTPASPRSSASASGSCTSVRAPAAAASCAIPAPIVPAPRTATTPGALTAPLRTGLDAGSWRAPTPPIRRRTPVQPR